ncbi:MAG TPA: PA14 domain-containing protein [Verrucomicrobiae bacterium]|nr:PA14 domain-containing protein [Verrucomicrobiae bacterium]
MKRAFGTWPSWPCWLLLVLPALTALTLVQIAGAQCVTPTAGLVSWWPGEGSAEDIAGGHPGVLMSGVTFVPGKVGQAFNFDGVSSYVRLPDNCFPYPAAGNGNAPFSFEIWFATANAGVILGQTVADPVQSSSEHVPAIYVGTGGKLRVQMFWKAEVDQIVSPANVNDGLFHHLAVTYDGTNQTVFLDSAWVGTKPFTELGYAPTYHYQLGTGYASSRWGGVVNGWFWFKGQLDEPTLYNRALSSNEVRTIYTAGQAGKCKPPAIADLIYSNNFEGVIGQEWSTNSTAVTPRGGRRFLGQFGNQIVTLTLSNLPAHTNLTVGLDLFLINTWDGSGAPGPDLFDVSVEGGQALLHTSFANTIEAPQSFPGTYRVRDWPGLSGALEIGTLDYKPDAVYRLSFAFGHVSDRLQVRFQASGLQGLSDESWGLDNVSVYANGPSVTLTEPASGSEFTTPTNLLLSASASAGSAPIQHVQFLANNVLLGTVTNAPFLLRWTNADAGVNVLMARVTDDLGRTAVSQAAIIVNGLVGEYFNNTNLAGTAVSRRDPAIDFDWNAGQPIAGVGADRFSIKWTGQLVPRYSENYTFFATADDGVRLWIDGRRMVNEWRAQAETTFSETIALQAGQAYSIQFNYYDNTANASTKLEWESPSQGRETLSASQLFPPKPGLNRPPNIPVITQPAQSGWTVDPTANLALRADFFSDPDTGQTHAATDWEIWTVSPSGLIWVSDEVTGSKLLTNSLNNGTFVGTHVGLSRLLYSTDYELRVRHRDSSGATNDWSEWAKLPFNTRPPGITGAPYVLPPYATNTIIVGDAVTLGITATNIAPSATYQWRFNGVPILAASNTTLSLSNFSTNQAGEYTVVVSNPASSNTSPSLLLTASYLQVCGVVWEDRNADGILSPPLIHGERPDIVFVIDRSHSTVTEPYVGDPVGDVNGDGIVNSRLDAEIAAFIALNNALITQGYTNNARVAVVSFGDSATNLDLDVVTGGAQWAVAPSADTNHNRTNDVEEVLRTVHTNTVAGTDYHLALLAVSNVFLSLGSSTNGNVVFVSDGESDREGLLYTNDVAALLRSGTYLRAFGTGSNAIQFLPNLQLIDPNAQIFTRPEQLVEFFGGPTGSLSQPERGLAGVTLYLDLNNNGQYDSGEPIAVSSDDDPSTPSVDEAGRYCFDHLTAGTSVVRELTPPGFSATYPASGHVISEVHVPLVSEINFGLAPRSHLAWTLLPSGAVTLTVEHAGGINHRIEISADLQRWTSLTNLSGAGPVLIWTDPVRATSGRRFYRAVQR